ncbi:LysR substrate-binding domain-containing protein [Coxiella-like endosymbiont]|uniref:LysR substrate-binding domain-containing protein n=1 Tax=Coxiella-like endosymbiont TaxID=1592897 RepID=UPI00272C64A4|nr:LysR substrate-binding domain-containing protein [Coxiella-like endosymbiont]
MVEKLIQEKLDSALVAIPLVEEEDLEVLPLFEEEFVLTLPYSHALTKRKILKLSDLENKTLLFYLRKVII